MRITEKYEAQLASEGLAPLDMHHGGDIVVSPRGANVLRKWNQPGDLPKDAAFYAEGAQAVEMYLGWAKSVLERHEFTSDRQRAIWRLYAEGKPIAAIVNAVGGSLRSVSKAIAAVERQSPPAPCPNPWQKSGRDRPRRAPSMSALLLHCNRRATAKLCLLALQCADRPKLVELVGDDPELSKFLPTEAQMPAAEVKRPVKRKYSRILLRRGWEIYAPKKNVGKDRLLDVEGTPHAGGIDVDVDGTVITVPWWKIQQADQLAAQDA